MINTREDLRYEDLVLLVIMAGSLLQLLFTIKAEAEHTVTYTLCYD